MFKLARSPFDSDNEMLYAERTGAGYPAASTDGTVKYQCFRPIQIKSHQEQNFVQSGTFVTDIVLSQSRDISTRR